MSEEKLLDKIKTFSKQPDLKQLEEIKQLLKGHELPEKLRLGLRDVEKLLLAQEENKKAIDKAIENQRLELDQEFEKRKAEMAKLEGKKDRAEQMIKNADDARIEAQNKAHEILEKSMAIAFAKLSQPQPQPAMATAQPTSVEPAKSPNKQATDLASKVFKINAILKEPKFKAYIAKSMKPPRYKKAIREIAEKILIAREENALKASKT